MGHKRQAGEDYESDNGFVEDAPRSKKSKPAPKSAARVLEQQKDDDGNTYWEISSVRRVQVSDFKGKTFVGIREFYEKDGKALPGKKGISLSIEQLDAVIDLLPQLEAELKKKGHHISRPIYSQQSKLDEAGNEDEDQDAEASDHATRHSKGTSSSTATKANHEATSDEDDD